MREAKIEQERFAVGDEADIVGLDVAVNKSLVVQRRQGLGGLARDPQGRPSETTLLRTHRRHNPTPQSRGWRDWRRRCAH